MRASVCFVSLHYFGRVGGSLALFYFCSVYLYLLETWKVCHVEAVLTEIRDTGRNRPQTQLNDCTEEGETGVPCYALLCFQFLLLLSIFVSKNALSKVSVLCA